jgi:hypothetical protein
VAAIVVAIEIGSHPKAIDQGRKDENKSRQFVVVRHSGKKSYFDLDSRPMPVMILKVRHRFRPFSTDAASRKGLDAAFQDPPNADMKG